eukprot:5867227-Pleurochrysis_carterae.AAC.3
MCRVSGSSPKDRDRMRKHARPKQNVRLQVTVCEAVYERAIARERFEGSELNALCFPTSRRQQDSRNYA